MDKNKEIQNDLKKIYEATTIKWIEKSELHPRFNDEEYYIDENYQEQFPNIIFGEKVNCRYDEDQGNPLKFDSLEKNWQEILKTYGNKWNKKRQIIRFMYTSMRAFFTSFQLMRVHKITALNKTGRDQISVQNEEDAAAVCIMQMYTAGKKAIDLIKECDIKIGEETKKFAESRNLLFEHNHNPYDKSNKKRHELLLDPQFFEISNSSSFLSINIHTLERESQYRAFIDYYQDYYDLEKYFSKVVRGNDLYDIDNNVQSEYKTGSK